MCIEELWVLPNLKANNNSFALCEARKNVNVKVSRRVVCVCLDTMKCNVPVNPVRITWRSSGTLVYALSASTRASLEFFLELNAGTLNTSGQYCNFAKQLSSERIDRSLVSATDKRSVFRPPDIEFIDFQTVGRLVDRHPLKNGKVYFTPDSFFRLSGEFCTDLRSRKMGIRNARK